MVISKTPFRISFFGGGTDLKEWYLENGGQVISTSIDKYCHISCKLLPKFFDYNFRIVYSKIEETDSISEIIHPSIKGILTHLNWNNPIEIHHFGDLPARSGLGSSSSFSAGLLNLLLSMQGQKIEPFDLAMKTIFIEQNILKETVGDQDQIACSIGGFNHIKFKENGGYEINPIKLETDKLNLLQSNLLLFYTGISRFASEIEKSKVKNFKNKKIELNEISQLVDESINILNSNKNMDDFGLLLNESWNLKKSLSTKVSNKEIDEYYEIGIKNGALGGKILGAGGGGFLLFYAPKEFHMNIKNKLNFLINIEFKFENNGSKILKYN